MRRAVYRAPETIEVEEVSERVGLGPGDVRLRVDACGVCGSDIASYFHGHYVDPGQVMGHEVVGTVLERGAQVAGVEPGDRVVARPLRTCGVCWYCRRGDRHLCGASARASLGYGAAGGFADELVVGAATLGRDLHLVADELDVRDAVWAEPLAVALHGIARGGVRPGADVLVVGSGPLGLCAVAAATAAGARVAVVEPREARRDAAVVVGAERAAPPGSDLGPADVVLDASGRPAAIAAAAASLRPGGVIALLGLSDAPLDVPPSSIRIRGSFAYSDDDFRRSVALLNRGAVRLGQLVTHRFPVADTATAIRTAAEDESAVKVIVESAA